MKYNRQKFCEASDTEKMRIVGEELELETHNGTTKADLLMLLEYTHNIAKQTQELKERDTGAKMRITEIGVIRGQIQKALECGKCGKEIENISAEFDFCPYCGQRIEWGY